MEALLSSLVTVGQFIQRELTQELLQQGHKATGKLIDSIQFEISKFGNDGFSLDVSFLDYGIFVDTGRKVGKKRVPIRALVDWIVERGIARGDSEVLRAAFAIREKIFKEGIPTRNSFQFSNNGRRTKWFTLVVENPAFEQRIIEEVSEAVGRDIELFFDNMVEKRKQEFESAA